MKGGCDTIIWTLTFSLLFLFPAPSPVLGLSHSLLSPQSNSCKPLEQVSYELKRFFSCFDSIYCFCSLVREVPGLLVVTFNPRYQPCLQKVQQLWLKWARKLKGKHAHCLTVFVKCWHLIRNIWLYFFPYALLNINIRISGIKSVMPDQYGIISLKSLIALPLVTESSNIRHCKYQRKPTVNP